MNTRLNTRLNTGFKDFNTKTQAFFDRNYKIYRIIFLPLSHRVHRANTEFLTSFKTLKLSLPQDEH